MRLYGYDKATALRHAVHRKVVEIDLTSKGI